jgi:ATP-dependent Clp protease ATP-binding subunit ClpC
MTSNVGADLIRKETSIGFVTKEDAKSTYDKMKTTVLDELKKSFKPEFLNRVDETVVFRPLSKEDLEVIIDIMLSDVNHRLEEKGLFIAAGKKVKKFLVEKGFDPKFGARPLRRTIEEQVENPLSEEVLKGKFTFGMEIKAELKEDQLVFTGKLKKIKEKPPVVKEEQKKLQEASK